MFRHPPSGLSPFSGLLLAGLVSLGLLIVSFTFVQAAPLTLPPRPFPETPTPTPVNSPAKPPSNVAPLILQAPGVPASAWTVVQWKGGSRWFEVEGWRGEMDENNEKKWWVTEEHFGQGPFRWVIYADRTMSQVWGLSDEFYLPPNGYAQIQVAVTPVPPPPTTTPTPTATPKSIALPKATTTPKP